MFRNLLIIVAIFGIGWGASFGAGVAFGRRTAPTAQAAAAPGGAQVQVQTGGGAGGGGAAAPGGQGQLGGQARIAAGTVERVDGQILVLTAAQGGQQTRVNVTDQTQILKQTAGTTADLTPGTPVTVQPQGQPAADGALTAGTIMIGAGPAGGPGAAIIQRPGGGQGAQAGR